MIEHEIMVINEDSDLEVASNSVKQIVNATIEKRRQNARDTLTNQLTAGRWLTKLRPLFPYGEWYKWIDGSLTYSPNLDTNRAYAQRDMQLWRAFSSHIDSLIEMGAIYDIDNPEEEYVNILPDDAIEIAGDIASLLSRDKVSDNTRSFILELIHKRGEAPTRKQANRLIETINKVDELDDDDDKKFAYKLIESGLSNPDIVEFIPEIVDNDDLRTELELSGNLHVPGSGDNSGRSIPISNLSSTDVEIVLGRHNIEKELQTQETTVKNINATGDYMFIRKVEGTVDEIHDMLKEVLQNYLAEQVIKINIFAKYSE